MTTRSTVLTLVLVLAATAMAGLGAAQAPAAASSGVSAAQDSCSFPTTLTDATGTDVTVDAQPQRIVVLQPSDAQLVWEIGAQDRVVGMPRTQYTSYLDGRNDTTDIKNDDLSISIEQVVGLQPDLVLAANATDIETVRELRRDGLTVYHFGNAQSLSEIATNIETGGVLTGDCAAARDRANEFRLTVETVRQAAQAADERPSVFYYFFGYTTGTGTHIHDAIETAGGDNIAANAGIEGYQQANAEVVIDRNPEWIVYPDDATIPQESPYTDTTALQENQTLALDYQYISQPGPRVAIPLVHMAKTWYPDELAAANESVTMANVTTPNRTATAQSSGGGSGFGVGVALVALVAVALLARQE